MRNPGTKTLAWIATLALIGNAAAASPAEPDVAGALDALAEAAEADPNLSPEFKAALADLSHALRAQDRESASGLPGVGAEPQERSFSDRLHGFGDYRLRFEHDTDRPGRSDRTRGRVRLRIGASYDITDDMAATFRIRTGNPEDPNSPHRTLNSGFDSFEIALDRAFLRWDPSIAPGLWIEGGKVPHRFRTNPVYGELVWDADVNPEGGTLGYGWSDGTVDLGGTLGFFSILEENDSSDATLFDVQGSAGVSWTDELSSRVSLGFWSYANLTPGGDNDFVENDDAGNAVIIDPGTGEKVEFVSDFHILNPVASLTWTGLPVDLTLAGEYIVNLGANIPGDEGWAVGARASGKVFDRVLKGFYQYQYIEQDAILSAVAQDDFLLATNFKGHVFGADYGITRNVGLRAWTLVSRPVDPAAPGLDQNSWRFRLDLNTRF